MTIQPLILYLAPIGALLSLWFFKPRSFVPVAIMAIASILWFAAGQVSIVGLLLFPALVGMAWLADHSMRNPLPTIVRWLVPPAFIALLAIALLHLWPGITNIHWLDGASVEGRPGSYSQYFNIDKLWAGFALLWALGLSTQRLEEWRRVFKPMVWFVPVGGVVLLIAILLGVVSWSPAWAGFFAQWIAINVLVTSLAEEVIFRGYFQTGLAQLLGRWAAGKWIALGLVSVFFGAVHAAGGAALVVFASVMGVGYGYAYMRSGRIETAIIAHGFFNAVVLVVATLPGAT